MTRTRHPSDRYDVRTPFPDDDSPRIAGLSCALGGLVAVVGAVWTATVTPDVSDDRLSYPFDPATFRVTELVWTLTHLLTFLGALALVRSGLAGSSRTARWGSRLLVAGMAWLVPTELAFAFIADAAEESTASIAAGTAIGLAATVSGIGFVMVGVGVLRERRWAGWGRVTPLLSGVFVVLVLVPLQAAVPALFLWTIAGWNACLVLLGLALTGAAQRRPVPTVSTEPGTQDAVTGSPATSSPSA